MHFCRHIQPRGNFNTVSETTYISNCATKTFDSAKRLIQAKYFLNKLQ